LVAALYPQLNILLLQVAAARLVAAAALVDIERLLDLL
jgi:hypothetical protein